MGIIILNCTLHLIACSISGSRSSLPSALVQFERASSSDVPRSLSANLAASPGGDEFMELYSARAALDGSVTMEEQPLFLSPQQTCKSVSKILPQ